MRPQMWLSPMLTVCSAVFKTMKIVMDFWNEERYHLENGFILNVGGINERKNIVRLIHAWTKTSEPYLEIYEELSGSN